MSASDRSLKGKAREQIVSVAIPGSCIRTKPGTDPGALAPSTETAPAHSGGEQTDSGASGGEP